MSNETNTTAAAAAAVNEANELDMAPTLEEQLQAALAERDQFKDKWTRALADHDNYRRRINREMDEDRKYAAADRAGEVAPHGRIVRV